MGEVYRARDTRLDRAVAIKLLPASFADRPDAAQRFRDRSARHLVASAIRTSARSSTSASRTASVFLVMEYLEGETLDDRLIRGPLPSADVLLYATQIAGALDHAHREQIIHRDLKPSNVMLTRSGAKLLDFGLAKGPCPAAARNVVDAVVRAAQADRGRDHHRHVPVHGARAARRQAGRCANGHLRVRHGAVRDGDWPQGVRRREPGEPDRVDPHRAAPAISSARTATRRDARSPRSITSSSDAWRRIRTSAGRRRETSSWSWNGSRKGRTSTRPSTVSPAEISPARGSGMGGGVVAIARRCDDLRSGRSASSPVEATRFVVAPPPGTKIGVAENRTRIAISPDGRRLAMVASREGRQQIWIRSLDSVTAEPLAGLRARYRRSGRRTAGSSGFSRRATGVEEGGGHGRTGADDLRGASDGCPPGARDGTILFTQFLDGIFRVLGGRRNADARDADRQEQA